MFSTMVSPAAVAWRLLFSGPAESRREGARRRRKAGVQRVPPIRGEKEGNEGIEEGVGISRHRGV